MSVSTETEPTIVTLPDRAVLQAQLTELDASPFAQAANEFMLTHAGDGKVDCGFMNILDHGWTLYSCALIAAGINQEAAHGAAQVMARKWAPVLCPDAEVCASALAILTRVRAFCL